MSKEERIQQQVAAVERIRKAHGVTVFEREDGEDIDVLLRDCGLCIDTKELTKACGILWKALIAAETKLEPQTVNKILKALPELLADYAEVAKDVDGNLDQYRKARIKRINKLLGEVAVDRVLALAPDLDMEQAMEIAETPEPQTVAETIDLSKEAFELLSTFRLEENSRPAKQFEAVKEWLKSFVQRIHSSAPDTKGLLEALEKIAECCLTEPAKGVDWEQQRWTNMRNARKLAESALTSYRERK